MSHYAKQAQQLERVVAKKAEELNALQAENARLRAHEAALATVIGGYQGGVGATAALITQIRGSATASPASSTSGGGGAVADGTVAATAASFTSQSRPSWAAGLAEEPGGGRTGSASSEHADDAPPLPCGRTDSAALLASLQQKEAEIQAVLQQVGGGSGAYEQLYSTWLLRRVAANPARAAATLAMGLSTERREFVRERVLRLGVLLPKYDSTAARTALGTARQQVDDIIDDMAERFLTVWLWDAPKRKLVNLLVNLDTGQHEPYPAGWWTSVAETIGLTEAQKHALKLAWKRLSADKLALTEEHKVLSASLTKLQQEQYERQQRFEALAQQLQELQLPPSVVPQPPQPPSVVQSQPQSPELLQVEQQMRSVEAMLFAGLDEEQPPEQPLALPPLPWNSPAAQAAQQHSPVPRSAAAAGAGLMAVQPPADVWRASSATSTPTLHTEGGSRGSASSGATPGQQQEELLVQVLNKEHKELERQIDHIHDRMKSVHTCMTLHYYNVLSKQQLARAYVASFPWITDWISLSEALDELGW